MNRNRAKKATAAGAETPKAALRCDKLPHAMNRGKEAALRALFSAWRETAALEASLQWRAFWSGEAFDNQRDHAADHRAATIAARGALVSLIALRGGRDLKAAVPRLSRKKRQEMKERGETPPKRRLADQARGLVDPLANAKERLGAARVQMVRYQVVGMLRSVLSNRQNEFVRAVMGSSLDETARHMLLSINVREAWFRLGGELTLTVKRPDGSTQERVIPMAVRRLARKIMSAVLKRRRKPSMRHIGMVVDHRAAVLAQANKSSSFPLWIELATLERKLKKDGAPSADFVKIAVPLKTYERFDGRKGQRKNALQISQDREGRIAFGVVTDIASGIAERQADPKTAYVPEIDFVSLDFGLKTLVATDRGDLRGRGFLQRLKHYDELIVTLVRNVQRSGMKPRQSKRYCKLVERLRGFIKTEVCRVLNALVERLKPGMIVVERLRFHSPELSKRLNRIVQNCGRKVVADRLKALGDEFAIASEELNPAYSSQTCSSCGYMDAWNRRDQRRFECLWCGLKINADVNAGRNLGGRRWSLPGSFGRTKGEALSEATRRFAERRERPRSLAPEGLPQGGQGPAADPRWTNPCFKDWAAEARSSPNPDGCAAGTEKCRQTQALAA